MLSFPLRPTSPESELMNDKGLSLSPCPFLTKPCNVAKKWTQNKVHSYLFSYLFYLTLQLIWTRQLGLFLLFVF